MSKNPCIGCGACCAHFRVSFFWGECQSAGGSVPDEKVIQISPNYVSMKGTEVSPTRCSELCGKIGSDAFCGMYSQRSSTCREFDASFEKGDHETQCDKARLAHGLPPLTAENWI